MNSWHLKSCGRRVIGNFGSGPCVPGTQGHAYCILTSPPRFSTQYSPRSGIQKSGPRGSLVIRNRKQKTKNTAPELRRLWRSEMFYYISFLRPPPSSAAPGSISFTPQVANDLRTELFPGTQDIYYAWLSSTEFLEDTQVQLRKLMIWTQAVAYKEISISLPPISRPGQYWRLLLSGSPSIRDTFTSLGNIYSTGKTPLPVISMPIKITPKPDKTSAKQTQIERMYRVPFTGSGDLHFLFREQTSFDLDKVIDLCLPFRRQVC